MPVSRAPRDVLVTDAMEGEEDINRQFESLLSRRKPRMMYRGVPIFEEVQYSFLYKEQPLPPPPLINPETELVSRLNEDPSIEYDQFRAANSELIFDDFGFEFPS